MDLLGMIACAWTLGMLLTIVTYIICEIVKGKVKRKKMDLYSVYKLEIHLKRLSSRFPSREELIDLAKVALLLKGGCKYVKTQPQTSSMSYRQAREMAEFLSRSTELYMSYDVSNNFLILGEMYVVCRAQERYDGRIIPKEVKDIYYVKGEGIDDLQQRLY